MVTVSQQEFEQMVAAAIDAIPKRYADAMNNVGFVVEDEPNEDQRQKLHLVNGQTLYGLYEGIPLTQRTGNYSMVLPDKITIFKRPIEATSASKEALAEQVYHTIWHEVAHHFGLDHGQIHKLDNTA
jgi:predicted Zn-dependent protease with MMP-like domain